MLQWISCITILSHITKFVINILSTQNTGFIEIVCKFIVYIVQLLYVLVQ